MSIEWTGTTGKVTGEIKHISDWTDFDPTNNTGHFLPFVLDAQYEGREIAVIGSQTTKARSRYWVVRLDALYEGSKKLTVKDGESVIFDLDFTPATLAEA